MIKPVVYGVATFALLQGCASAPLPPIAPTHPASPAAAEAPPAAVMTTLGSTPQPPPDKSESAAPRADVYTCPMHPQARAPQPGSCPICGMQLIPAESAPTGGHHAH
jgi:hypothetical protein